MCITCTQNMPRHDKVKKKRGQIFCLGRLEGKIAAILFVLTAFISFGRFNISCQIRFPNQLVSFFNLGTNARPQTTPYPWWIKSKYCTIFYDFGFPTIIKFTLIVFFLGWFHIEINDMIFHHNPLTQNCNQFYISQNNMRC
jgi:hypothetical protein